MSITREDNDTPGLLSQIEFSESLTQTQPKRCMTVNLKMPFDIWCQQCNKQIAKGSRISAEKRTVGFHFSARIFEYVVYCKNCNQKISLRNDPQTEDYKLVLGARATRPFSQRQDKHTKLLKLATEPHKDVSSHFDSHREISEELTGRWGVLEQQMLTEEQNAIDDFDINQMLRKKRSKKVLRPLSEKSVYV
ncbi:hypothetical protein EIN_296590 [Entamoeba invadens IP1]|uniref:Uncharacterized protein n=1 Tax=Entamoeba invadens IP1 TaxID=370355 RepID=L7FKA1_ENTIV|nr:hypothetical protein EIN_296590 [Entamoeba invadens IP1]ELP86349.1 hypothetical protein EIN_296590 [Entamoeba invadens IP1]|eukprot:XP_004185695.1 hypothetical protein EIN_296590 [Entamoeba invadens IP1]